MSDLHTLYLYHFHVGYAIYHVRDSYAYAAFYVSCFFLACPFFSINIGHLQNIFFEELRRKGKERIWNIEQGMSKDGAPKALFKYGAKRRLPSAFYIPCSLFDISFWFRLVRAVVIYSIYPSNTLLSTPKLLKSLIKN